jgi:signal transduction histidine kinase
MNDERQMNVARELRRIAVFADLSDEDLAWLAAHGEDRRFAAGDTIFHQGDPANAMHILLEGEYQARADGAGFGSRLYVARAGDTASEVSGKLPYSRLSSYAGTGSAVMPTRIISIREEFFPEMLARIPILGQRLVSVMSDRIREVTKADQQRDKLMALGKLSAGLAHELNNPAAAARRAAVALRETLITLREANMRLDAFNPSAAQREFLANFERHLITTSASFPEALDIVAQSDREEEISAWLDAHSIADSWNLAPPLIETGLDVEKLRIIGEQFEANALSDVLVRITAQLAADRIINEIETSAARISELVKAIKEYTYMDQAPVQEVDIHGGLESTLVILGHKLKGGVRVTRDYDRTLPRISAYGSELNQVWTNLIDNAIDAMHGKGELRVRTSRLPDSVLVEITDNGPGILAEIKPHIFEPFFTTKDVGEGTGLGLDTSYRIVRKHHGEIRFDSEPGATRFQVQLPLRFNSGAVNSPTRSAKVTGNS